MKKILVIGVIIIVVAFTSHAQNDFSKQNLEQVSRDELNHYLKKAENQKTTGIVLSIAGPVVFTSIILVTSNFDTNMSLEAAGAILLIGTGATLIGIPLMIVGSSRVKKVKNALSDSLTLELAPCNFYNYQVHSHQAGVTLRLKF